MLLVATAEHRATGVEVERRGQLPGRLPAGLDAFGDRASGRAAGVRDPKPRDRGKPTVRRRLAGEPSAARVERRRSRAGAYRSGGKHHERRYANCDKRLDTDRRLDSHGGGSRVDGSRARPADLESIPLRKALVGRLRGPRGLPGRFDGSRFVARGRRCDVVDIRGQVV
jgi:hypothetical protein